MMKIVNTEKRRKYLREYMRSWRIRKGLTLSYEERERRRKARSERAKIYNRLRAQNPEMRIRAKYRMLKHRYGLTKQEVDILNSVTMCPICKKQFTAKILDPKPVTRGMANIDHDHSNNKVRGVLCGYCNYFVGKIEAALRSGRLALVLKWINKNNLVEQTGSAPVPPQCH